jgi:hypothetical protein
MLSVLAMPPFRNLIRLPKSPGKGAPRKTGAFDARRELKPQMSEAEFAAFASFIRHSERYLEFGAGGSTYAAAQLVKKQVTSVDSSQLWLDNVRQACLGEECAVKPTLFFADIGPVGEWGTPVDDPVYRPSWPTYYEAVWRKREISEADLYLIDGRFRVACFLTTLLNCREDALIMIHDFANRPQYHVIRDVAREVASVETLSIFTARPHQDRGILHEILNTYRFDPE